MLLTISMVKKLLEHFMKKSYKIQINKDLGQKIFKRKGNKLYFKQKGFDNSFKSWIGKND